MANKGIELTKDALKDLEDSKVNIIVAQLDKSGDPYRFFKLLRFTGMHPRVIAPFDYADKKRPFKHFACHETVDGKGRPVIQWNRPKKTGAKAFTQVPKHHEIDFSVDDFIAEVQARKSKYKKSTLYVNRCIRKIGEAAGIAGLSPLSLRHTLAVQLQKGGMRDKDICDTLNISMVVLRTYGRMHTDDRNTEFSKAMMMKE